MPTKPLAMYLALVLAILMTALPEAWAEKGGELLLRLRFRGGETALGIEARDEVRKILAALRLQPGILLIMGCASGKGPAAQHDARLRTVMDFLLQNGISSRRVRIISICGLQREKTLDDEEVITVVRE